MPTILRFIFPASALLALVPAAAAEPDARNLPLWEAGVGAAVFSTPAYPGSSDRSNRGLVLPFLCIAARCCARTRKASARACWTRTRSSSTSASPPRCPRIRTTWTVRRGMPDLGTLVEFGPRVKYKFADLGDAGRAALRPAGARRHRSAGRPAAPGLDDGAALRVGTARRRGTLDDGSPAGRRVRRPAHPCAILRRGAAVCDGGPAGVQGGRRLDARADGRGRQSGSTRTCACSGSCAWTAMRGMRTGTVRCSGRMPARRPGWGWRGRWRGRRGARNE